VHDNFSLWRVFEDAGHDPVVSVTVFIGSGPSSR